MSRTPSPRAIASRPLLVTAVGLILLLAALLAILQYQGASYSADDPGDARHEAPAAAGASVGPANPGTANSEDASGGSASDGDLADAGGLTASDGLVPDGVTVFDDEYPAVAKLDPALLQALHAAAADAGRADVQIIVTSGWRSARYQQELLREAVVQYGSAAEAARWVATPQTSAHVSGDAVDLGPSDATAWLSRHGAQYGLCQIYRNEPWHFELRPDAIGARCPAPYADPTQDPRMQQ